MVWWQQPAQKINTVILQQAQQHQQKLTKPAGSLGRLEELAIKLASQQGNLFPVLDKVHIVVFAADHGIAEENVSAFPQVVTREMVRNFSSGGAAICVLSKQLNATLEVVDVGTVFEPGELNAVVSERIAEGTANFSHQPAMTDQQLQQALQAGHHAVERALAAGNQLLVCGEMGIANTTSATALAAAILGLPAAELAGPGTGLDSEGVKHKARVIDKAIDFHKSALTTPATILQYLGGFEIAALTGSYISAAQQGITVVVDGFIATVAALLGCEMNPSVKDWLIFSHHSAEPGYTKIIEALKVEPLLNMGMRLGEGSGAALSVCVLRQACALHNQMATFAEAQVSTSE